MDEVQRIVGKVVLDTGSAVRSSRDMSREQDRLRASMARVTQAERDQQAAAQKLRDETIRLRKAEVEAGADKKKLAEETKQLRLRMLEQAEATRRVRDEAKRVREEQKLLQGEMRATARAAQESARAQVAAAREAARAEAAIARDRAATLRAQRRSEDLAARAASMPRRLAAAEDRIKSSQEAVDASRSRLAQVSGPFGRTRAALSDARGRAAERFQSGEGLGDAFGKLGSGLGGAASMVGGAAALGGGLVGGAIGGIGAIGGEFEKLRTSLETIEGSKSKAEATFAVIQNFAATTPYQLQEVTTAVVKLKARGLDSSLPALKAYGDTASAMGKSLDEMIEAVADATTGEFERLKEFGVEASTQGDKIKFTFKGVETTVQKDAKAIEGYLKQLGEQNFAGGMEKQSQTLGGMLSTLSDNVAQLADQAFRGGLGDALKEVVADMGSMIGQGNDLAKVIGKALGDAVKGAWDWLKKLIGPVDQLDEKFASAWKVAGDFVRGLQTIAEVGASIVSVFTGGSGTTAAVVAFGVAVTALLGPLGAVATLGATIGATLVGAFRDSRSELELLQMQARAAAEEAKLAKLKDERAKLGEEIQAQAERSSKAQDLSQKVIAVELRKRGASDISKLSKSEQQDVLRAANNVAAQADSGGDFARAQAAIEADIKGRSRSADAAEFQRLNARRKSLSPAEKKRLNELSKDLDVNVDKAGGKAKLDAFSAARKKEIDDLVKREEERAGDAAVASGNAAGAGKAAKAAGSAARARLNEMAAKGALPGEVERALLRQAGFEDVQNAPPPPIIVYQQTFKLDVEVTMPGNLNITGDPESAATDLAGEVETVLERDILPRVADMFRGAIRR